MIRLVVTLNAILLLVAVLYLLSVNTAVNTLFHAPIENHYQRLGQGTLQLLNEAVAGLNAEQRQQKLSELQQQFIYELNLRHFAELALTKHEQERLNNGLVLKRENNEADYLYGQVAGSDNLVWEFALDQTRIQDEANTSAGTYFLLQQELANAPQSQWSQIIAKRQQQFGFPLVLHKPGELEFSTMEQQQLVNSQILVVLHDKYSETHYQQVGDSGYVLQLGTFTAPFLAHSINYIVGGLFLLSMVLASYFWLWPIWRNLMQIQMAAEAFGHGKYDTRVPHHKRSRLAGLTHAFNAMAERTQGSIQAQKELTSAVSHELRTPVARMRFSLDMLAVSDNTQDRQRYVDSMNLDINELNVLLEEMLTYARLEQGADVIQADMQDTLLQNWFAGTMQDLKRLAVDKQLVWHSAGLVGEVTLIAPVMMSRVVNNLVQNALRYADSQVEVVLSKTAGHYVLQVDDDGPGIPQSERERLFTAFAIQDGSRNKELAGFGLGLAIVLRIIEGHQGKVSIDDADLGGARFLVSWPVRA